MKCNGMRARYSHQLKLEIRKASIFLFLPSPNSSASSRILDEAFDGIATAKANAEKNLQNARALFESHLQSRLHSAGEGWVKTHFGDICICIDYRGRTPREDRYWLAFVTAKNVKNGLLRRDTALIDRSRITKNGWLAAFHEVAMYLFTTECATRRTSLNSIQMTRCFSLKRIIIIATRRCRSSTCTFLKYLLISHACPSTNSRKGYRRDGTQAIKASLSKTY